MDPDSEVHFEFFPIIRQYKSGRVVRFGNVANVPAGTDTARTGVASKDVVIDPSTGLWARLFLPPLAPGSHDKLPVVVYYHGGAFVVGSAADPFTQLYLNGLAAAAHVLAVAVDYRLAPEHPLPMAYDDSWDALRWVASHAGGGGGEPWLAEHGDFSRVFLDGCSAGGNIAHDMAVRAGARGVGAPGVAIRGLLVIHPYFSGEEPVGSEASDPEAKAKIDAMWRFLCPGTRGPDDPLNNPFSAAAGGSAARLGCDRVLVCVAEKDELRDRGVWYYERLKASGYGGELEMLESEGEGHVFHCFKPGCERALELQARTLAFIHK